MGFSAQVQQSQTGGSGKGSPIASAAQQVAEPQSFDKSAIPSVVQDDFTTSNSQPTQSFADTIRPMGKGGAQTNSATSGQPRMGQQNQYSNTVGQWDNTQQQTQSQSGGGKGKG